MKRSVRFVVFLLLGSMLLGTIAMALAMILPASAKEKNMISNGEFSDGTARWQTWASDPASGTVTVSADGGVGGSSCLVMKNTSPAYNSLFQYVACKQGGRYMMTCDVRYENVSTDGRGFCLGNAAYDTANNNIGETLSDGVFGTSAEWRTVSFIFEVQNDPARMTAGPRLWGSTGTVYVDNVLLVELTDEPATSGEYDLTLSDAPNRHTVNSLGCEWDPKMLTAVNREHGITEDDLVFIKGRMQTLGVQGVRMMVQPDWFEKTNDNDDPLVADPAGFDFDNDEMRSVFAYLGVCEELGVQVTLTWWGAPTGHWLAFEDTADWIGAPNDLDEMAENISYLLGYIREELKYTCVKELILQNEPSYSFTTTGNTLNFDYYVQYYQTVKARLAADGMEDLVLVGADDSQHYGWYSQSVEALRDVCGKFDSHNYAWSYDTPYLDVLVREFVSARTSLSGETPFYLGEFGDGSVVGAYVAGSTETYGRGLYVASVVVNALGAGASGVSYWPLHDIYYYDGDPNGGDNGGLMSQGLIGFKRDGAWTYRPTYYAYGLLCNYIPYGSTVYDIKGDTSHYVDTVAAKTEDGRWSVVAVNRSDAAQTVHIEASAIGTKLATYTYLDGQLPADGTMIEADAALLAPVGGVYTVTLPAESFMVLSSIGLSADDIKVESETASAAESETSLESEPTTACDSVTDTTAADTESATADTPAESTSESADSDTAPAEGEGCTSVASGAAAAVLGLCAGALLVSRRRKTHSPDLESESES